MIINKAKVFFIILCILQLFYLFNNRSEFKFEIIKDPFNKKTGLNFAVSAEIIESNYLLKNNKLANFNLSESIKKDTYLFQRSIEFNYPIRVEFNSKNFLYLINEPKPNNCKVLETGKYLKLIQC
tara:strand:+ start:89 stop:463 length:375 start_codon:yes stop_codon:yes gene_type:complete